MFLLKSVGNLTQGQIGTKNLSKTLHFVYITRNTTLYILNEVPSLRV